jgi:hypothetical protein
MAKQSEKKKSGGKTPVFGAIYIHKNDLFTKTGSGET